MEVVLMAPDPTRDEAVEHVEFRGQRWFVADARFDAPPDDMDVPGHWHLTLTAPQPIRRKRCGHDPNVSVTGCAYCADAFVQGVADRLGVERETRRERSW